MKKLSVKNYKTNSNIFVEEGGKIKNIINIDFDGWKFENKKEFEEFIIEKISEGIDLKEIDKENLDDVLLSISIIQDFRIK